MVRYELMDRIISDLRETCLGLNEVLADYGLKEDELTMEDLGYLDDEIFCCDNCGWWCSTWEKNTTVFGSVCNDCYDEIEEWEEGEVEEWDE